MIYNKENIKLIKGSNTVIVPYGVTEIDCGCFGGNEDVHHIILPNTLKKIGHNAFTNCNYLLSIHIPENVEYIGNGALEGNYCLSSVRIDSINLELDDCIFLDSPNVLVFVNPLATTIKKYCEEWGVKYLEMNWLDEN